MEELKNPGYLVSGISCENNGKYNILPLVLLFSLVTGLYEIFISEKKDFLIHHERNKSIQPNLTGFLIVLKILC